MYKHSLSFKKKSNYSFIICSFFSTLLECKLAGAVLVFISRYLAMIASAVWKTSLFFPLQGLAQSQLINRQGQTIAPLEIADGEICNVKISLWHLQGRFVCGLKKGVVN